MNSLHPLERALHWAQTTPEAACYIQPVAGKLQTWTWAQALYQARQVAAFLELNGVKRGQNVAILSKNCAWWLIADLGIWLAGAVSVPLYPTAQAATLYATLEHAEVQHCFVGKLDDFASQRQALPIDLRLIGFPMRLEEGITSWASVLEMQPLEPVIPPLEALATIIYTSGSSGTPKGVMHSFANIGRAAQVLDQRFGISQRDRMLSYLPLAHAAERCFTQATSLYAGFPLYFADTLESFLTDLKRAEPTVFISVPRLWARFQKATLEKIPHLETLLRLPLLRQVVAALVRRGLGLHRTRFIGGGGSALPIPLVQWYAQVGLQLLEAYGMTENFAISHAHTAQTHRPGWVGVAQIGVKTRLGAQDEVLVNSPCNMLGYYKNPELSQKTLVHGWLHTGDIGLLDGQHLKIIGRLSEPFKSSKGKWIYPSGLENALGAHGLIESVCVCGLDFEQPFALVYSPSTLERPEMQRQLEAHLKSLNQQLESHERLQFMVLVREPWTPENGFLTPTLKLKRSVIEAHYQKNFQDWHDKRQVIIWQ